MEQHNLKIDLEWSAVRAEDYPVSRTVKVYRDIIYRDFDDAMLSKDKWVSPDYFTASSYDAEVETKAELLSIASDRQFKMFNWLNANRQYPQVIPYFGNPEQATKRIFDLMDSFGRALRSASEPVEKRERLVNDFLERLRNDLTQWGTWWSLKTDLMASVEDAHAVAHKDWHGVPKKTNEPLT